MDYVVERAIFLKKVQELDEKIISITTENTRLEGELVEAKEVAKDAIISLQDEEGRNDQLQAQVDALKKYPMLHLSDCNYHKRMPFSEEKRKTWKYCTCGLVEALDDTGR